MSRFNGVNPLVRQAFVHERAKNANQYRPVIIDTFFGYFLGQPWKSGQSSLTTTLSASASKGATGCSLTSVTGLVSGTLIIINETDTYVVNTIVGNDITTYPLMRSAYSSGTTARTVWYNEYHPGNGLSAYGYTGLGKFIANAKRIEYEQPSYNILTNPGFEDVYTDANGETNCPVGWESLIPASLVFGSNPYSSSSIQPHATGGAKGSAIIATAAGAGLKSDDYLLTPGYYVFRGDFKYTSGKAGDVTIGLYKSSDDSAVWEDTFTSNDIPIDGALKRIAFKFHVPTRGNCYLKIVQAGVNNVTLFYDTFAFYRAYEQDETDAFIFENVGNEQIAWLGDSWINDGFIMSTWETQLQSRYLHDFNYINAGIGGDTTDDLVARFQNDVISRRPYMCVVHVGVNDGVNGIATNTFLANYDTIIETLQENMIIPVILTVPPLYSFNQTAYDWNDDLKERY